MEVPPKPVFLAINVLAFGRHCAVLMVRNEETVPNPSCPVWCHYPGIAEPDGSRLVGNLGDVEVSVDGHAFCVGGRIGRQSGTSGAGRLQPEATGPTRPNAHKADPSAWCPQP